MEKNQSASLLSKKQKDSLEISGRIFKRELRQAERALTRMRERYLDTLLPLLTIYLNQQFERHKNDPFGGGVGRFDVAEVFTKEGIEMDFRLAEKLLAYAYKKRKAYLIAEGEQGHDDYYSSKAHYDKHLKIR